MAVGKTTTAKELAKMLQTSYLDTDSLIEFKEDKKITDIFNDNGEEYFRNLEQKCANYIEHNINNSVIATGGGFYKVKNIKKLGKIVWLNASFDEIYAYLQSCDDFEEQIKKRPLLKDKQKAKELYDMRFSDYEKICDIKVDIYSDKPQEIFKSIIKQARG